MAVWQDFYVLPLLCKNLNDAAFKDSYPLFACHATTWGQIPGSIPEASKRTGIGDIPQAPCEIQTFGFNTLDANNN